MKVKKEKVIEEIVDLDIDFPVFFKYIIDLDEFGRETTYVACFNDAVYEISFEENGFSLIKRNDKDAFLKNENGEIIVKAEYLGLDEKCKKVSKEKILQKIDECAEAINNLKKKIKGEK